MIDQIRACCIAVLPTVWQPGMSIWNITCRLTDKLNEVINTTNELPEYIKETIKQYITSGDMEMVLRDLLKNYILNVKYPPNNITPAKGDGSTDDTASIQACIDYAYNNGGGAIFFPTGQYLTGSLQIKDNVTLYSFDKYSSQLVLKSGVKDGIIYGIASNISFIGLTFDGNSGNQVNDVTLFNVSPNNMYMDNCVLTDGYQLMKITNGSGNTQLDNVTFGMAVTNALTTNGATIIQAKSLIFEKLSRYSGNNVITINTSYGTFDFNSTCQCQTCLIVNGNNNNFDCKIQNATNNYTDFGHGNLINVIRNGTNIQNFSGTKELSGDNLVLNPDNPLTYKSPIPLSQYFDYIPMQDKSGTEYKVLVYNGQLVPISQLPGTRYTGKIDILYHNIEPGYYTQGMAVSNNIAVVSTTGDTKDNNTVFYKFDLTSHTYIGSYSGTYYHANSLIIDENKGLLYSLDALDYSTGTDVPIGSISVFNWPSMQFTKRINTSCPTPFGLGLVDGTLYIMSTNNTIYSVNTTSGALTPYTTLEPVICGTSQGGYMDTQFIYYVRSNYNCILAYNHDGKLDHVIDVGTSVPFANECYEIESIYFQGDNFYLANHSQNKGRTISNIGGSNAICIFKGSKTHDTPPEFRFNGTHLNNIYVNKETASLNPVGTDAKPFATISDAYKFMKSCPPGKYSINVAAGTYQEIICLESANAYILRLQGTNAILQGGIYMFDGNLYINNGITFDCSNMYMPISGSDFTSRCLIKIDSYVHAVCSFSLDGTKMINGYSGSAYKPYIINCGSSQALCYLNAVYDDTTKTINSWFRAGGNRIFCLDNGSYIAYDDNVIVGNAVKTTFNEYVGKGRFRQFTNLKELIPPGKSVNLKTLFGASIVNFALVKCTFTNGTVYVTNGMDRVSIFCTAKQINGISHIIRTRCYISTDNNYTFTWDAVDLNLNVTKGTVSTTQVVTDVNLGYTNITSTNYIDTYGYWLDRIEVF